MLLTSTNHFELALHVVGYQYPDNADDKYDSNWLYVDVRLRNSHGIWRAIIPHLLTWEVRHLAAWLRLLADGQPVPERMGFIEPALVFALDRRDDQALTLWVWFWLKGRHRTWIEASDPTVRKIKVKLHLRKADLAIAAASLLDELGQFPERAGAPTA